MIRKQFLPYLRLLKVTKPLTIFIIRANKRAFHGPYQMTKPEENELQRQQDVPQGILVLEYGKSPRISYRKKSA